MTQHQSPTFMILFSTVGSADEAARIANHLVSNRLVACVNIVPSIQSVYWGNNAVQNDQEILMIIKTEASRIQQVEEAIRKLHSYQTPELIGIRLEYGIPEYLEWLNQSIQTQNS